MTFIQRVVDFFSFSTRPVTVLTLATYAAILIASIWIHEGNPHVPSKPSKQLGLDLDAAWNDLEHITTYPHPYNSHQNDVVRAYILARVKAMGKRRESYFHISDDNISNGTYAAGQLIYFEGNNILVKIDGSDYDADQKGGILVSAHFDSVSTAPGATDNGMGTATTLSLIDYFAKNRPSRNIIFNLNNGEEDWLNGAHAFLEHPWASLVSVFLNLEGAGNGGLVTEHAFKRRVVRSGTDFEVYDKAGMKGLDLAFYRQRARYHTKYDSVPALGGQGSLWSMMAAGLQATQALDAAKPGSEGGDQPVYFDLFGATMIVLEQNTMFILNVVALAVGPLIVAAILVLLRGKGKLVWSTEGWFRFPLASIAAAASTIGLANLYSKFSTYIIYSSSYSVLASLLITFYLILYAILRTLNWYKPPSGGQPAQRAIVFLQTYFFWWSFLILDTVVLKVLQVGGLYFVTFYHAGTLAALVVSLLEMLWVVKGQSAASINGEEPTEEEEPRRSGPFGDDEAETHEEAEVSEATERTSLLPKHADRDEWIIEDHRLATPLWGIEFLLAAGFPIILTTQIALLLLTSMSQTLADGNKPLSVYLIVAIFSSLIILPLAPFIHKIHRVFSLVLVFILIATVAYNMLAFPFSLYSPLKVYFQQTVDLDANGIEPHNVVELVALQGYLERYIVPSTPSGQDAVNKGLLTCGPPEAKRAGLWSCRYPGPPPNVAPISAKDIGTEFGSTAKPDIITFNATRLTANTGKLTVKGRNTRSCRLYFDDPIKAIHVKGGNDRVQPGYPVPEDGVKEVRLWSRTWDKEFEVLVEWEGKVRKQKVTGRVACEWAEMREGRIPALEEVLGFSPMWTAVTKLNDGLVEVYKKFEM
ncbi:hypothetical protein FRC01_011478 [Tulasnella sp. 417]|nr:hypothetical protein FRC01_011478 [Tulasnella sp. 417]